MTKVRKEEILARNGRVGYDKDSGNLTSVPKGHGVRLEIGRLVRNDRYKALDEAVPERKTHTFALHPDKWRETFYSLTNKDPEKIIRYKPSPVPLRQGTVVLDMALANRFMRGDDGALKLYKESKRPLSSVSLDIYKMPELLIPPA